MTHFKDYFLLVTDAIFLAIPWVEDLDSVLKAVSLFVGVLVAVYTVIRIRKENRIKDLEIKIKEQELKNLSE